MIDRDDLIFDRNQADIDFAKALQAANQPYPLDESLRFSYDWRTLNRVEDFVKQIAEYLKIYGYDVPLQTRPPWTENDRISSAEQKRYIGNLHSIRYTLGIVRDLPNSINPLPFETANAIEKYLYDIEPLVQNMALSFKHFGSFRFGQEFYLPNYREA